MSKQLFLLCLLFSHPMIFSAEYLLRLVSKAPAISASTQTFPRSSLSAQQEISKRQRTELNEALLDATSWGSEVKVAACIKRGADVNYTDRSGETALLRATRNGYSLHKLVVLQLLEAGSAINHADGEGYTALINIAKKSTSSDASEVSLVIDKLVTGGVIVDHATKDGYTALMYAAMSGNDVIVQKLLAASASVNLVDTQGETALLKATRSDQVGIARQLLIACASVNQAGAGGDTALKHVIEYHRKEVLELMRIQTRLVAKDILTSSTPQLLLSPIADIVCSYLPYGIHSLLWQ